MVTIRVRTMTGASPSLIRRLTLSSRRYRDGPSPDNGLSGGTRTPDPPVPKTGALPDCATLRLLKMSFVCFNPRPHRERQKQIVKEQIRLGLGRAREPVCRRR